MGQVRQSTYFRTLQEAYEKLNETNGHVKDVKKEVGEVRLFSECNEILNTRSAACKELLVLLAVQKNKEKVEGFGTFAKALSKRIDKNLQEKSYFVRFYSLCSIAEKNGKTTL